MTQIDEKIREVSKRKKFTSFWEVFDYMKLANYEELEAMMTALQLFDGKVWDRVINAAKVNYKSNEGVFASGCTISYSGSTMWWPEKDNDESEEIEYVIIDDKSHEPDNLMVEIFLMTNDAMDLYKPLYKSYIETRKYKFEPELEKHIKSIKLYLTTELAIKLFMDGYNQLK